MRILNVITDIHNSTMDIQFTTVMDDNLIIDIHDSVVDIHNYFSIMQVWISVIEFMDIHEWVMDIHDWFIDIHIRIRISIISKTGSWMALIEEWILIRDVHVCLYTVGLLSSGLVAWMSWGYFIRLFSFTFPMWWKFHFVVIHFLVIRTNFVHALTA